MRSALAMQLMAGGHAFDEVQEIIPKATPDDRWALEGFSNLLWAFCRAHMTRSHRAA